MKRGPEDHLPLVSMKFSLIARAGPTYNSSQTCGFHGDLAINGYYSLARRLGMKCFHLRWVSDKLTGPQKANRARYAQEMIEALDNRSQFPVWPSA
jgi:hypothetical protein